MPLLPIYLPGYYLGSFLLEKFLFLAGYNPFLAAVIGGGLGLVVLIWVTVE